MSVLSENPLPIIVIGSLAALMAAVVFASRRNLGSLMALAGIAIVTLLLVGIERFMVTDREQVEEGVDAVFDAIETNNLSGVLEWIDPEAARMQSDVKALMPLVKVETANSDNVEVTLDEAASPPTATASLKGFLDGVHTSSGMRVAYFNQRVDVQWVKRGERWLITGYTAYFDGKPIDAVGSARGNRPVGR